VHGATIDSADLNGIACPSRTFCGVVDGKGRVVTGHPGGGWAVHALHGAAPLEGVACTSTHECVAVDSSSDAYVGR
jgi:hypothetical protein